MEKSDKRFNKIFGKKSKASIILAAAAVIAAAAGIAAVIKYKPEETAFYPVKGFSNMCSADGIVYCGVNGAYGEPVVQQSSIFTIQDEKVYYVEKVQAAYDSMTDELLSIRCSDMDGSNERVLVEDVFLAGAGHEKLAGDKLFYGYAYDDNYRMRYAYYDLNTQKRKAIKSDRIDNILGYDGNYLYYNGYDTANEENILGRIYLKSGKDETLTVYAETDEAGYIDSVSFSDGKFYCLTLTNKTDGYDYRTYEYHMQIRSGESGEVEREIPVSFTGSSNYSFLVQEGKLFTAIDGKIIAAAIDGNGKVEEIANLKKDEYWGILHFIPGDGYLYYEAIAEVNEETGNNDYFYRVPVTGGVPELLKSWFTA